MPFVWVKSTGVASVSEIDTSKEQTSPRVLQWNLRRYCLRRTCNTLCPCRTVLYLANSTALPLSSLWQHTRGARCEGCPRGSASLQWRLVPEWVYCILELREQQQSEVLPLDEDFNTPKCWLTLFPCCTSSCWSARFALLLHGFVVVTFMLITSWRDERDQHTRIPSTTTTASFWGLLLWKLFPRTATEQGSSQMVFTCNCIPKRSSFVTD